MSGELERFAALVREETGNVLPAARLPFLAELLERRARARGCESVTAYLDGLAAGRLGEEWAGLLPLITIKESSFFRAPQQFEAIRRAVLPQLLPGRTARRRLRIWSAACACGEEPATLALVLAETPELAGWDWRIVATDVDPEALARAERGLYGERAVAQVPPALLERYFTRRGSLLELDPRLRSRIDYRPLNLAHFPYRLPDPEYDLALVRNVLIYFRRPLQRRVLEHVAARLAPDGYAFLGASETLWQLQDVMLAVDLGDSFCYRHPAAVAAPPLRPLAPRVPHGAAPAAKTAAPRARKAMHQAPKAPAASKTNPPPAPTPPDRLFVAAGLVASDRLAEARSLVEAALREDPSEPSAHALAGFLADLGGEPQTAAAAYRAALYLEPAFFQVRLLLADCLQRLGDRERARGQYREVLASLAGGRARDLALLAGVPLPDRAGAARRSRQVLGG